MKHILLVVAKEPVAGQTKTRLANAIGFEAAADLYRCMLLDMLDIARQVPGITPAVTYLPPTAQAEAAFRALAPGFALLPQQGASLGERLDNVLTTCLLHRGYTSAAVIGSDSPLVDPQAIAQGFAALEDGWDVALGPCDDGGYYLLATRAPCPSLLRDIQMSTPTVAAETMAAAERAGLRLALLPSSYDVDTPADLERLHADLRAAPAHVARHTRAWLTEHSAEEPMSPGAQAPG